jgi:hypothetical protein
VFLIRFLVRRVLVLAVILAIPIVAGEFVARKLVGDAVKSAVAARFGGSPSVSFGSTPLLWQLVNGRLDDVTVTEEDASVGGLPPVSVSASFKDVTVTKLIGLHGIVNTIEVNAGLGPAGVRDLLGASACGAQLAAGLGAALTADPRVRLHAGYITLLPPHGRAVVVRLAPSVVSAELDFRVVSAFQDGAALSPSTVSSLGPTAGCLRPLPNLPFNLVLVSATAVPGALELEMQGSRASFQE